MVMVAIGKLREQPRPERTALPGYEFRMSGLAYDMYGTVRTKREGNERCGAVMPQRERREEVHLDDRNHRR